MTGGWERQRQRGRGSVCTCASHDFNQTINSLAVWWMSTQGQTQTERCGLDTMTGMQLGVPAYLWKPAGQTGRFSGREGHDQSLLPQLSQGQGIPVQHNHTIITWEYLCNTTTAIYNWVYLCNTTTTKYHLGVPVQHNHNKISPVQHNNISPGVPVQHN